MQLSFGWDITKPAHHPKIADLLMSIVVQFIPYYCFSSHFLK